MTISPATANPAPPGTPATPAGSGVGIPWWVIALVLVAAIAAGTVIVRRVRANAPRATASQGPVSAPQPEPTPRAVPDDTSAWSWDHLTADERAAYERAMRSLGRS